MNIRAACGSACIVGVLIAIGSLFSAPGAHAGQIQFSPPGPPRDQMPPPRVGTGALKGRVVDGATGSPLARARIRIGGGGGQRPSVMTDPSGAFAFVALPAGPYTVSVEKTSYQSTTYPDRGRGMRSTSRPLILQDGQILEGINIPLYRGGVITGRVVDANGDPVEWAQVRAFKVPSGGRGGRPVGGNSTSTNDLGEYRLARLDTGSYLLMATPQRVNVSEEPGPDGKPQTQPQPAPTYYPNVVAMDQAQPVPVPRGQTVSGIDIAMGEALMAVITGTVIDPTGQPVSGNARISVITAAKDGSGGSSSGTGVRPDGTFRALVVPGDYLIEARLTPPTPGAARAEPDLVGTESVTVTSGGSETLLITLGRGATATGRVVFDGTSPLPQNLAHVSVPFFSTNGRGCSASPAEIASDWSFKIEGVVGTCTNPPSFGLGRWMLKAILYDGEDLVDRPVTFKTGQQYPNVQVVFTDRRTEITFRVSDQGGQTTREYVALVFPSDKTRWNVNPNSSSVRAYVPPQTDMMVMQGAMPGAAAARAPMMPPPPRREVMAGLRPGDYLAIAVDNIEYEDTRDTGILAKLAAGATRVTIGDGASLEVPLRRVSLADVLR